MSREEEQIAKVIKVFTQMMDYIGKTILKAEPQQITEMMNDIKVAKEAIDGDDWAGQIQKGEGFLLQEKAALIKKIDDLQPIVEKLKSMKAFW